MVFHTYTHNRLSSHSIALSTVKNSMCHAKSHQIEPCIASAVFLIFTRFSAALWFGKAYYVFIVACIAEYFECDLMHAWVVSGRASGIVLLDRWFIVENKIDVLYYYGQCSLGHVRWIAVTTAAKALISVRCIIIKYTCEFRSKNIYLNCVYSAFFILSLPFSFSQSRYSSFTIANPLAPFYWSTVVSFIKRMAIYR